MRAKRREGKKARIQVLPVNGSPTWKTRRVVRAARRDKGRVRLDLNDYEACRIPGTDRWVVRDGPPRLVNRFRVTEGLRHDAMASVALSRLRLTFPLSDLLGRRSPRLLTAERCRIWREMEKVGVPVIAIARLFGRHHTTVLEALGHPGRRR